MTMLIGIAVDESTYVIIKDNKVIRSAVVIGAKAAYATLKPKKGEQLYIKVRPER